MRAVALPLLFAVVASPCAAASEPAGRYAFVPVESGALRLDTTTGAVSMCGVKGGETLCTAVPIRSGGADDYAALQERIDKLEARIATLERADAAGAPMLSDTESMDRVMMLADRMMRRFFGLVRDLKRDMDSEEL